MRSWFQEVFDNLALTTPVPPPKRWDWALSLVLTVLVVVEVAALGGAWPAAQIVAGLVAVAALPMRRRWPILLAFGAFVVQLGFDIAAAVAGVEFVITFGHVVAGLMLAYALSRWPRPELAAAGFVGLLAVVFVDELLASQNVLEVVALTAFWLLVAILALAMRYRAALRAQREQQIRLTERNDLARELHDTVAHHVSAIAVQAQAAQFVAERDPTKAVDAVKAIEAIANETIDEMRRMVGVLRSDDDHARTVAATSLDGLADPQGKPKVVLTGRRALDGLPPSVAAAVYRTAQEAVTNARRHSRGVTFVDIDLELDDAEVRLAVVNDGQPTTRNSGGGYGLVGMSERLTTLGGTLESGPRTASGWRVLATIPLRAGS